MRFDATLKELVQIFVRDYAQQFGLADLAPLNPVNVDLSTMTAATDIVLSSGDPIATLVDLNFQAGYDATLARRLLTYNAFLHLRHGVPVHSMVVLLRPDASFPALNGEIQYQTEGGKGKMSFTEDPGRSCGQRGNVIHLRHVHVLGQIVVAVFPKISLFLNQGANPSNRSPASLDCSHFAEIPHFR